MVNEINNKQADEAHEVFVQRASNVFPESKVRAWSRIERAVFNSLMARLIHQQGYSAISNEMLQESREAMDQMVRHFASGRFRY